MKKLIIFLFLVTFSFNAYPFWIWSPKTQKWKNPKYSALATPFLQYKSAVRYFEKDEYKDAYREFKKLLVHYPDSREAAEAQYYLALCLEKFDKPYEAFLEYKKLIDTYPNSQRINEVVEREYSIGEYYLNREHKKWLGISFYDFVEHPSIEIFQTIVNKVPYSEYAPRAQYKTGIILMQLGRYDEARDAFQKTIDNYSDSEWATPAKYQLAIATSKAFPGADYDSSYLKEATERLDEFIKEHPDAQISSTAQDQLKELRNREAKKAFDTALFYENQDQYRSAVIYLNKVVSVYPDSDYYDSALEKTQELGELIDKNITRKELEKKEKREEIESKRVDKLRAKENKKREKQEIHDNKINQKQERIQTKKDAKLNKHQAKLDKKQVLRDQKKVAKQAKITVKQERVQAKKDAKLNKRQVKRELKAGAKARKQALRQEKISRKEELRKGKKSLFSKVLLFWKKDSIQKQENIEGGEESDE